MEIQYRVNITKEAQKDIDKFIDHFQTSRENQPADKVITKLADEILIFEDFPRIGRIFKKNEQRLFSIFDGKYIVAYVLDEAEETVRITAIKPSSSNWQKHLNRFFKKNRTHIHKLK